jgi:hypothetical protein
LGIAVESQFHRSSELQQLWSENTPRQQNWVVQEYDQPFLLIGL